MNMVNGADFRTPVRSTYAISVELRMGEHCHKEEFLVPFLNLLTLIVSPP